MLVKAIAGTTAMACVKLANTERVTFDIRTAAVRCLFYLGGIYILREFKKANISRAVQLIL